MQWLARAGGALSIALAVAALAFWVHLFELPAENTWDAALFLSTAKLMRHGLLLYRDLWDPKPPGVFWYMRGVFAVLPVAVWSVRLTDYILYVLAGLAFFRLCRLEARVPLALLGTGLWLVYAHHPDFDNQGFYTEEYAVICGIGAVLAAARYWRRGGARWVIGSGVAAAGAMLCKHPGAACALPALVLLSGRRPTRALPLFALAMAVPLAAVVAAFWWRGALEPLLDAQMRFLIGPDGFGAPGPADLAGRTREFAVRTWEQLAPHPALLWPAVGGAAIGALRPTRPRVAALVWLVADLLGIAAQRYYYPHYFIAAFASAVLVAVFGAAWILEWRPSDGRALVALRSAGVAALVLAALVVLERMDAARRPMLRRGWALLEAGPAAWPRDPGTRLDAELGTYLRERTAADDRVFIFDTGSVAAVYWVADRVPASRYLLSIAPTGSVPRRIEQLAELAAHRPAYVVVTGNPVERHFSPYLREHYGLMFVRDVGSRAEIWALLQRAPFTAGTLQDLVADPARGGLAIGGTGASRPPHGLWASPVLERIGGGDALALAWRPRAAGDGGAPPGVGTGIRLRYRTGPTPDLAARPWGAVPDEKEPQIVRAQRFVQVECELVRDDAGADPVLHFVRIGPVQFQLDGGDVAHPMRTAGASRAAEARA
jgi:hypothetical protein